MYHLYVFKINFQAKYLTQSSFQAKYLTQSSDFDTLQQLYHGEVNLKFQYFLKVFIHSI